MPSYEPSVVTSLHELRAIEQQRIADELAVRAAQAAEREAARLAEAARVEAAARAVRDAELAEAARVVAAAEAVRRAEALAIACAEATVRARAQVELDAERMAHELRVRREQVARTRPIGLLAVIGALVLGGAVLGVVLVQQRSDLDARQAAIEEVRAHADHVRHDSDALVRAARGLQDQVDTRNAELAAQKAKLDALTAAAAKQPAPAPAAANRPHVPPAVAPPRGPIVIDSRCTDSVLDCLK